MQGTRTGRCCVVRTGYELVPVRYTDWLWLFKKGTDLHTYVLVICLSLALLLTVIALVREARLRRALQKLLQRLLVLWRSHVAQHPDPRDGHAPPGDRGL